MKWNSLFFRIRIKFTTAQRDTSWGVLVTVVGNNLSKLLLNEIKLFFTLALFFQSYNFFTVLYEIMQNQINQWFVALLMWHTASKEHFDENIKFGDMGSYCECASNLFLYISSSSKIIVLSIGQKRINLDKYCNMIWNLLMKL